MNGPLIASFCTGYGGLDHAVHRVFGGELAWVSDIDPGACQIIAHRMPGVTNIGDLTTADYHALIEEHGRPHIVLGGYPCQPFSNAGRRLGVKDERHIWPDIARALGVLRPRIAIFENVAGHLRLGFDVVLADLARLGFDVEWCTVRASEVGAPHRRSRLFIYATATDTPHLGHERAGRARERRPRPADRGRDAAHPGGEGLALGRVEHHGPQLQATERSGHKPAAHAHGDALRQQPVPEPRGGSAAIAGQPRSDTAADTASLGRGEGRPEPTRQQGRPGTPRSSTPDWGAYTPAVRRWEHTTGRPAPRPTDDRNRLSPRFVEWLMGLPAGWVTDVPDLTRTQQLKALGNGVVVQQAEAAIRLLHARATRAAA